MEHVVRGMIDFAAINDAALSRGRSLVADLVRGGKFHGDEYVVRNPRRDDQHLGSFKINCRTGKWVDFATGDRGGDIVSLFGFVRGISGQGDAARELAALLGVPFLKPDFNNGGGGQRHAAAKPQVYDWGDTGPQKRDDETRRHYYASCGVAMKLKIKYRRQSGWTQWYRTFSNGVPSGWQASKPDKYKPIPFITAAFDPFDEELRHDTILWPEGEKDVENLSKLNVPAFTFGGVGDGLPEGIDAYLKDRHIVILADNDEPGRTHAEEKAQRARAAGAASIKIVHFRELPEKGDVSDFIAGGGTVDQLNVRIDAAPIWLPPVSDTLGESASTPSGKDTTTEARASWLARNMPIAEAATISADDWPKMDKAAYHGLAGDFVKTIELHSEADPAGLLVQSLAAFGNIVGSSPHFSVEGDKHRANLFAVLVGKSARGRKGTGAGRVRLMARAADEIWSSERNASGLSSGEGLINSVRDETVKWNVKDQSEETIDPGVGATSGCLLWSRSWRARWRPWNAMATRCRQSFAARGTACRCKH
jgi:hypothetical protein